MDSSRGTLATKDDIASLRAEIVDTREEIANLRGEIGEAKTKMIRWMFIFWLAQVEATFLIFLYFVKG